MELLHNFDKTDSDGILILGPKFFVNYCPISFFLFWYRQPAYFFDIFCENVKGCNSTTNISQMVKK
jgi:hypothetical protein